MNKVIFPLNEGMQGSSVGDLQSALQIFLDRAIIRKDNQGARKELSAVLQCEHTEQIYGKTTSKLVSVFQHQQEC